MGVVLLYPDGSIGLYNPNRENTKNKIDIITNDNCLSLSQYPIKLNRQFTLRSYFKMILKYPILQQLDIFFLSFIKEYEQCPKENCKMNDIDEIGIAYNYVLSYNSNDDHRMSNYLDVSGYLNNEPFGIDFTPLKNLLDIEIFVKDSIFIKNRFVDEKLKFKKIQFQSDILFQDFVCGVIGELSFYGEPEGRDNEFKKLKHMMDDIREENLINYDET